MFYKNLHLKLSVFRILEEQTEALKKKKIDQMMQKIDIIIAGKKQKLLKQGLTGNNSY